MASNLCFPCTQECRPIPWKLVDLLWDPLEGNWLLPSSLWYLEPAQPAVESHNALLHTCWSTDWTDLVWDCTGNHSCCDLMQSHCLMQADVSWNDQVKSHLGMTLATELLLWSQEKCMVQTKQEFSIFHRNQISYELLRLQVCCESSWFHQDKIQ